ncbi:META domain-containing protein [Lentzea sp. NPDC058450]|uniref:META domain-containing protein n=1 Tax=Lentzea sp. NPDC058450 TaxID=3346505 RepID=UPI003651305C
MGFRAVAAAVAAVLLIGGCTGESPSTGAAPGIERNKIYLSTSVVDQGEQRTLLYSTRIGLTFTDDGKLRASAGCNDLSGQVSMDGGKLAFLDSSATDMSCGAGGMPGLAEQEQWLWKVLKGEPSWRLDGKNLVLTTANVEIVLAQEMIARLEGTRKVAYVISANSSLPVPEGVDAEVTFKEGVITVTSGCFDGTSRRADGKQYEVDDQTIRFGGLVLSLENCSAAEMEVDNTLLRILKPEGFKFLIEDSDVVIMNAAGDGLRLRK